MLTVRIDPSDARPMVEQIVDGIRRLVDERRLRPGTRLPSIRQFAESHGVSRFTAVEAYDRLVALGCLEARRGSGFFTAAAREECGRDAPSPDRQRNEQLVSLIRRLLLARDGTVLAGGPWLPNAWMDETGLRRALGAVARRAGPHLLEYGNPLGGMQGWCGDPKPWSKSIVDVDAYAGQTVQFRWRVGTDNSTGRAPHGWYVDDIKVQSCVIDNSNDVIFANDFEMKSP